MWEALRGPIKTWRPIYWSHLTLIQKSFIWSILLSSVCIFGKVLITRFGKVLFWWLNRTRSLLLFGIVFYEILWVANNRRWSSWKRIDSLLILIALIGRPSLWERLILLQLLLRRFLSGHLLPAICVVLSVKAWCLIHGDTLFTKLLRRGYSSLVGHLFSLGVLALAKNLSLEILESNHHNCHIVEGLSVKRIFEHALNGETALLMHALSRAIVGIRLPLVFVAGFPDTTRDVLVWHFVKNAIWG